MRRRAAATLVGVTAASAAMAIVVAATHSTPTPHRAMPPQSTSQSRAPSTPPASGVPRGVALMPYTGPAVITRDGTVIDGKDIPLSLTIAARDVVIRNSWVHGPSTAFWGIYVKSTKSTSASATIEWTRVSTTLNGITGDHYTASHVEVTALGADGFKIGDDTHLDHVWCHDLTMAPGAHADCGQVESGVTNSSITDSWLDGADNSALIIKPDFGPSSGGPLLIENNVLGKGNFTLYIVPAPAGPYVISNVTVRNNRFLRDYRYGPTDVTVPTTWTDNTWFDDGAPVTP